MSNLALDVLGIAVAGVVAWVQMHLTPLGWWQSTARFMATNAIAAFAVIVVAGLISGRPLLTVSVLALELAGGFLFGGTIRWIVRTK